MRCVTTNQYWLIVIDSEKIVQEASIGSNVTKLFDLNFLCFRKSINCVYIYIQLLSFPSEHRKKNDELEHYYVNSNCIVIPRRYSFSSVSMKIYSLTIFWTNQPEFTQLNKHFLYGNFSTISLTAWNFISK